jgi:predicted HNH restriction endonuclease
MRRCGSMRMQTARFSAWAVIKETEDIYGPEARRLIEMHHKRALYLQAGQAQAASIREALNWIVPLCPSCHRVVHFNRETPMEIEELRQRVAAARGK